MGTDASLLVALHEHWAGPGAGVLAGRWSGRPDGQAAGRRGAGYGFLRVPRRPDAVTPLADGVVSW